MGWIDDPTQSENELTPNVQRIAGDSNGDGRFNSADFVQVLQAGEYEDDIEENSTWEEGDWNGDRDFDSSDFVLVFQTGLYEIDARANTSELTAAADWLLAQDDRIGHRRAYAA